MFSANTGQQASEWLWPRVGEQIRDNKLDETALYVAVLYSLFFNFFAHAKPSSEDLFRREGSVKLTLAMIHENFLL